MGHNVVDRLKELLSKMGPDHAIVQISSELGVDTQKAMEIVKSAIESMTKTRILRAIVKDLERNRPPMEKINVTDIAFPCLRHAYYAKVYREERRGRLPELLALWIGVKLHEAKIFERTELELEYQGIYGRVDGYENDILLELKTTRTTPSTPLPHHVKQVSYYRVLLERNGYPVRFAIIVYLNVSSLSIRPFLVLFDQPIEELEEEMLRKKEALERALQEHSPPPPEPEEPWACDYCTYAYLCGYQMHTGDADSASSRTPH